jgi:hypothetical protein
MKMEITLRSDKATEFKPLPKHWVVERSFAWLGNFRRLAKDYERTIESSQTIYIIKQLIIFNDIIAFVILNASEAFYIPSNKKIPRFTQSRACKFTESNGKI